MVERIDLERFLGSKGKPVEPKQGEPDTRVDVALKHVARVEDRGDADAMNEAQQLADRIERDLRELPRALGGGTGLSNDPVVAAQQAMTKADLSNIKVAQQQLETRLRELEAAQIRLENKITGPVRSMLAYARSAVATMKGAADIEIVRKQGAKEPTQGAITTGPSPTRTSIPQVPIVRRRERPDDKKRELDAAEARAAAKRMPIETRPSAENDPFYQRLVDVESDPKVVNDIAKVVEDAIGRATRDAAADKALRQEMRQVARIFAHVRRSVTEADDEQIRAWSSEILDHMDNPEAAQPVTMVSEDNPFKRFDELRDLPRLNAMLTQVMQKSAELAVPGEVTRFKGALGAARHTANAAVLVGIPTYISFGVASGGFQNLLLAMGPHIPGIENLGALMQKMGVQDPRQTGFDIAKGAGLMTSVVATLTFSHYRAMKTGFMQKPTRFYVALWFAALSAASNIVERISEAADVAALGKDIVTKLSPLVDQVKAIQPTLMKVEQNFTKGGIDAAAKEALSGNGPKTMLKLALIGLLDPKLRAELKANKTLMESLSVESRAFLEKDPNAEYQAFLAKYPANRQKYEAEWTGYQNAVAAVATDKKYAELNFSRSAEGDQLLQVLRLIFGQITKAPKDGVTPEMAFTSARDRGMNAQEANMWDGLASSSHIPLPLINSIIYFVKNTAMRSDTMFEVKDVPTLFEMIGEKSRVITKLRGQLANYDALRNTQSTTIGGYLNELALKAAPSDAKLQNEIRALKGLLAFDALKLSVNDVDTLAKSMIDPQVKQAAQILFFDPNGWNSLGESLRKGGFDIDFGTGWGEAWEKRVGYILAIATFYTIIDLTPKYPVKIANAGLSRRFNREFGEKYNDINDLEVELADEMARRVQGFFAMAGNVIDIKAEGLGNQLPIDLLSAHIRRRLREVATSEPVVAGRGDMMPGLTALRAISNFAFGFHDTPEEAQTFNNYRNWLQKEVGMLRSGDISSITHMMTRVYPAFGPGAIALTDTLQHPTLTPEHDRAIREVSRSARQMRLDELRSLVPELQSQLALLKRGALELADRGEGKADEPVTLRGRGNLTYSKGHVNRTYVMNMLQDDIDRYTRSLQMIRTEGLELELMESGEARTYMEGLSPSLFRDALKPQDDKWVWRMFKRISGRDKRQEVAARGTTRDLLDFSPTQAARDSLVLNMRRRLRGYRRLDSVVTEDEFAAHMNKIDIGIQPLLQRFERTIESTSDPLLKGRKFIIQHEYHPAVQGPTITINTLGSPLGQGNPENIAIAPFTDFPIPDLVNGRTSEETLAHLNEWLEGNGPAMNMLKAQIIGIQMRERLAQDEKLVHDKYIEGKHPVRVKLDASTMSAFLNTQNDVYTNDDLHELARLRYTKKWLRENHGLLANTDRGIDVSPEQLEALRIFKLPNDNAQTMVHIKDGLNEIGTTLQLIQGRIGDLRGFDIFYDPKAEKDARIIFKRRSDGLEESVDVGAPGTEVNQMIDALEEVPVSRTKQVRQIGRRIARKA